MAQAREQGADARDPADAAREAQELMSRFEYVQQALQQVDGQLARLEQNSHDLRRAMTTLEALGAGEHESLVPIGGGLHVRARIDGGQPVVSPVGRGYAVEHEAEAAKAALEQRIAAAEAAIASKSKEAERLAATARQLANQIQALEGQYAGMV